MQIVYSGSEYLRGSQTSCLRCVVGSMTLPAGGVPAHWPGLESKILSRTNFRKVKSVVRTNVWSPRDRDLLSPFTREQVGWERS